MLLAAVEKALTAFVVSDDRTAIALKGPWGRGKTHYWSRFIRGQARTKPDQGYAYVSLFGLTSLDDLRRAVAMNARSLAMLNEPDAKSYVETAISASGLQRVGKQLSGNAKPYVSIFSSAAGAGPVLDELLQAEAKDLIVCIDDLERRGDGLRLADVLGYCSHLKERRGCRIIVILNEDAFHQNDAVEFARLSEKVFDHRVLFEPHSKECVAIAMPEGETRFAALREYCEKLEITNIRILLRAKRLIADFAPYVKNYDASIARQVARTGALLTYCYYGRVPTLPPYEYVRKFRDPMWARLSGTSKPTAEEKEWEEQLAAYGLRGIDDLDREVVKYIESGYVDAESLRALLADKAKEVETASRKARFDAAWERLFASFDHNEQRVLADLESAIHEAAAMIDADVINASAFILRKMGMADAATRIIRTWVDVTAAGRPEALDLAARSPAGTVTDAELLREIARAVETKRDPRSLTQVLDQLLGQEGWEPADIEVLRAATVSEYESLIRGLRDEKLKATLRFLTELPSHGEALMETKAKVADALRRIAADGPMNEWRVGRYLKL